MHASSMRHLMRGGHMWPSMRGRWGRTITLAEGGWEDACLRLGGTMAHDTLLARVTDTCGEGVRICMGTRVG
eukprot:3145050-Amphidinium_carterae.1